MKCNVHHSSYVKTNTNGNNFLILNTLVVSSDKVLVTFSSGK